MSQIDLMLRKDTDAIGAETVKVRRIFPLRAPTVWMK